MNIMLIAVATMTIAGAVRTEPPAGASEVHGAFGRMLTHDAVPPRAPRVTAEPDDFELMVAEALRANVSCGLRLASTR